jgi:hypothetical protein
MTRTRARGHRAERERPEGIGTADRLSVSAIINPMIAYAIPGYDLVLARAGRLAAARHSACSDLTRCPT